MIIGIGILLAAVIIVTSVFSIVNTIGATLGNSPANLANHGMVAEYNGQVYCNNGGLVNALDGKQLADVNSSYINIANNRVYFSNLDDGRKIYSMNLDGSDKKCISDIRASYVTVADNTLYCISAYDVTGRGIYAMNLDGTESKMIFEGEADCIQFYKNKIYFINADDKYTVYSMNLDGSELKKLIDEASLCINVYDDCIYYCKSSGIYKWKMGERYTHPLTDRGASFINVADDYIYFSYFNMYTSAGTNEQGIFRMDTNGRNITQIAGAAAVGLCAAGDQIYFQDVGDNFALKRVNADGSSAEYETVPKGTYASKTEESPTATPTAQPSPSAE